MSYADLVSCIHLVLKANPRRILTQYEFDCYLLSIDSDPALEILINQYVPFQGEFSKLLEQTMKVRTVTNIDKIRPQKFNVHNPRAIGERATTKQWLLTQYPFPDSVRDANIQLEQWVHKIKSIIRFDSEHPCSKKIHQSLINSECTRYDIRRKEAQVNAHLVIRSAPESLFEICEDFETYLDEVLSTITHPAMTFAKNVFYSLMCWVEAQQDPNSAVEIMIDSLDDGRTSYHALSQKFHPQGKDYSCPQGLEEAILDRVASIRINEPELPKHVELKNMLSQLISPFVLQSAGDVRIPSPFLYQGLFECAGYAVGTQSVKKWSLRQDCPDLFTQCQTQYNALHQTTSCSFESRLEQIQKTAVIYHELCLTDFDQKAGLEQLFEMSLDTEEYVIEPTEPISDSELIERLKVRFALSDFQIEMILSLIQQTKALDPGCHFGLEYFRSIALDLTPNAYLEQYGPSVTTFNEIEYHRTVERLIHHHILDNLSYANIFSNQALLSKAQSILLDINGWPLPFFPFHDSDLRNLLSVLELHPNSLIKIAAYCASHGLSRATSIVYTLLDPSLQSNYIQLLLSFGHWECFEKYHGTHNLSPLLLAKVFKKYCQLTYLEQLQKVSQLTPISKLDLASAEELSRNSINITAPTLYLKAGLLDVILHRNITLISFFQDLQLIDETFFYSHLLIHSKSLLDSQKEELVFESLQYIFSQESPCFDDPVTKKILSQIVSWSFSHHSFKNISIFCENFEKIKNRVFNIDDLIRLILLSNDPATLDLALKYPIIPDVNISISGSLCFSDRELVYQNITPLCLALLEANFYQCHHFEIIHALINRGALIDTDSSEPNKRQLLYWIASENFSHGLRFLLEQNQIVIDINQPVGPENESMLEIAVIHHHMEVSEELLRHHARLDVMSNHQTHPIATAIVMRHYDILRQLLTYCPRDLLLNFGEDPILFKVIREWDLQVLNLFLESGLNFFTDRNSQGISGFDYALSQSIPFSAILNQSFEFERLLLQEKEYFFRVVEQDDLAEFEKVRNHGSSQGQLSSLQCAIRYGWRKFVEDNLKESPLLIARQEPEQKLIVFHAMEYDQDAMLKFLLDRDQVPLSPDLLTSAFHQNAKKCFEFLLQVMASQMPSSELERLLIEALASSDVFFIQQILTTNLRPFLKDMIYYLIDPEYQPTFDLNDPFNNCMHMRLANDQMLLMVILDTHNMSMIQKMIELGQSIDFNIQDHAGECILTKILKLNHQHLLKKALEQKLSPISWNKISPKLVEQIGAYDLHSETMQTLQNHGFDLLHQSEIHHELLFHSIVFQNFALTQAIHHQNEQLALKVRPRDHLSPFLFAFIHANQDVLELFKNSFMALSSQQKEKIFLQMIPVGLLESFQTFMRVDPTFLSKITLTAPMRIAFQCQNLSFFIFITQSSVTDSDRQSIVKKIFNGLLEQKALTNILILIDSCHKFKESLTCLLENSHESYLMGSKFIDHASPHFLQEFFQRKIILHHDQLINHCFSSAAEKQNIELFECIFSIHLEHQPADRDKTLLMFAVKYGFSQLVEKIISSGDRNLIQAVDNHNQHALFYLSKLVTQYDCFNQRLLTIFEKLEPILDLHAVNNQHESLLMILLSQNIAGELFKRILSHTVNVNIQNQMGHSILWYMIHPNSGFVSKQSRIEIINLLLEKGLNLHIRAKNGMTFFMHACALKDVEIVEYLLQSQNINLNDLDLFGWNALMHTIYLPSISQPSKSPIVKAAIKIIELLLGQNKELAIEQLLHHSFGNNPAWMISGITKIQRMLKNFLKDADVNIFGTSHHAVNLENLRFLITQDIDLLSLSRCGQSLFHSPTTHLILDVLKEQSYDFESALNMINGQDRTPLHYAIEHHAVEPGCTLLKLKAKMGHQPLTCFIQSLDWIWKTCKRKLSEQEIESSILQEAIHYYGPEAVVESYFEYLFTSSISHAFTNQKIRMLNTESIHWILRKMIEYGIITKALERITSLSLMDMQTLFKVFSVQEPIPCVREALISAIFSDEHLNTHTDLSQECFHDLTEKEKVSIWFKAAKNNAILFVDSLPSGYNWLLEYQGEHGQTALMIAAEHHAQEFVEALVVKGVDLNQHDHQHRTAIDYAEKNGHQDLAEFLSRKSLELREKGRKNPLTFSQQTDNSDKKRKRTGHH